VTRLPARQAEPAPPGWELPLLCALVWVLMALLLLGAAPPVAEASTGHGFAWPTRETLWPDVAAVLAGHPSSAAGAGAVYTTAATLEVAYLALTLTALRWWWFAAGPGRRPGLATPGQARTALGPARLRRNVAVIRPDLHPTGHPTGTRHPRRQTRPRAPRAARRP